MWKIWGKTVKKYSLVNGKSVMFFKRRSPDPKDGLDLNPDYQPKKYDAYILDSIAKKYKGEKIGFLAENALTKLKKLLSG